jgi:hypothetical protein
MYPTLWTLVFHDTIQYGKVLEAVLAVWPQVVVAYCEKQGNGREVDLKSPHDCPLRDPQQRFRTEVMSGHVARKEDEARLIVDGPHSA